MNPDQDGGRPATAPINTAEHSKAGFALVGQGGAALRRPAGPRSIANHPKAPAPEAYSPTFRSTATSLNIRLPAEARHNAIASDRNSALYFEGRAT